MDVLRVCITSRFRCNFSLVLATCAVAGLPSCLAPDVSDALAQPDASGADAFARSDTSDTAAAKGDGAGTTPSDAVIGEIDVLQTPKIDL